MSDNEKPWLNEPDSLRFVDELTGLECYIWRHLISGSLNGYVIIPKNNKLYGIYDDDEILNNIEIHGGITFSGIRKDIDEYAIGFDCSHAGDLCPEMSIYISGDTYKDIEFVKAECRSLARQLAELSTRTVKMCSVNIGSGISLSEGISIDLDFLAPLCEMQCTRAELEIAFNDDGKTLNEKIEMIKKLRVLKNHE